MNPEWGTYPAWVSALTGAATLAITSVLLIYTKRQLDHLVNQTFLETIRDEKFVFDAADTSLGADAGEMVRHWIFRQSEPITYDKFKGFPVAKRNAIKQVLMAHDRVAHDTKFGLPKSAVMKFQAPEFERLWHNCKEVVRGIRHDKQGLDTYCFNLEEFVTAPDFQPLAQAYKRVLPRIGNAP